MSPPTQSNLSHGFNDAFPKALIHNELFQNRNLIGGVVRRAANKDKSIADGNRTKIQ